MTHAKPSIVFCHGLWADGSCFSKVIPALQAKGHQVIAAQYALNTTSDDVATVRGALGRVSSPAILVGHSYGGSVIIVAKDAAPSTPTWNGSLLRAWAPKSVRLPAATSPCSPTPTRGDRCNPCRRKSGWSTIRSRVAIGVVDRA